MSHIALNPEEFEPIIQRTVERTLEGLDLSQLNAAPQKRYLTEREAAELLGVEPHVLRDARKRGEINFHRFGRSVRYTYDQVEDYARRCLNREVGEPPARE